MSAPAIFPFEIFGEIFQYVDGPTALALYRTHRAFIDHPILDQRINIWHNNYWLEIRSGRYSEEFAEKYYNYFNYGVPWSRLSENFLRRHEEDVDWYHCDLWARSDKFQDEYIWTFHRFSDRQLQQLQEEYKDAFGDLHLFNSCLNYIRFWKYSFALKQGKPIKLKN